MRDSSGEAHNLTACLNRLHVYTQALLGWGVLDGEELLLLASGVQFKSLQKITGFKS